MRIIKKSPGIMLVEQYGNKYIQFDAGQISSNFLQIKITENESEKIEKGSYSMASVVNHYDNRGLCSASTLRGSLIKDYLLSSSAISFIEDITEITELLMRHPNIYLEFHDYIMLEYFPDSPIRVNGYTAESLVTLCSVSPAVAYVFLALFQDSPERAMELLDSLSLTPSSYAPNP